MTAPGGRPSPHHSTSPSGWPREAEPTGEPTEGRPPPGALSSSGADSPGLPPAPQVTTEGLPSWLSPVAEAARTVTVGQLSTIPTPEQGGRPSAVLVLFGEGPAGPELLLLERATSLRQHAGQPSFPGGGLDPQDGDPLGAGPLRAALREAEEETGLDPAGVQLFATLPRLYIPFSDFIVTPVLGWWRVPTPVAPVDLRETARVFTAPVASLADAGHRGTAVHPSGYRGPCFEVGGTVVWGFTAGVIDRLLHFAGWECPWDTEREIPLDGRT